VNRRSIIVLVGALLLLLSGPTSLFAVNTTTQTVAMVRANIVQDAEHYLGVPYVWGGNGPNGLDCSGLVCRVYREVAGKELPRTTDVEFTAGTPVDSASIKPGDLVFFNTEGFVSHVGIYIGHGRFIHAASAGPDTGVIVSSFAEAYYRERFVGARRFLSPEPEGTGATAVAVSSTSSTGISAKTAKSLDALFDGKFLMSFGSMSLRVNDGNGDVQGTFVSSGNAGWLVGKIDRSSGVLRASWVIPETSTHYRTSGQIIFKPESGGSQITGSWCYDGQKVWHDTWVAVPATR